MPLYLFLSLLIFSYIYFWCLMYSCNVNINFNVMYYLWSSNETLFSSVSASKSVSNSPANATIPDRASRLFSHISMSRLICCWRTVRRGFCRVVCSSCFWFASGLRMMDTIAAKIPDRLNLTDLYWQAASDLLRQILLNNIKHFPKISARTASFSIYSRLSEFLWIKKYQSYRKHPFSKISL